MASITFAVTPELKSEISKFVWINWSALAKEEILLQDEKAELFKELKELTKNSKLTDADCLRFAKSVKKRFTKHSGE